MGYESIGVELDEGYFQLAERAIPQLAALYPNLKGDDLDAVAEGTTLRVQPAGQMDFALTA